jgi:long-chain acyl-CoA synthetase
MPRRSLAEFVFEFQEKNDDLAYVSRQAYRVQRWTYGDVARLACRVANHLEQHGISKGDKVLLWGPNSAEWVGAFFGCVLRGAVVVPMDEAASHEFALSVCRQVSAKLALASHQHKLPEVSCEVLRLEDLQRVLDALPDEVATGVVASGDDVLEIVFTSGTTAEPKGVVITHSNVLANITPLETQINNYLKYERLVHPVRFLSLLPLSHMFGQFLGMFLPQLLSGTVFFIDTLSPSEIMRVIRQDKISVLVAVPRVLQSLKAKLERDLADAGQLADLRTRLSVSEGKHFLHRWWMFRRVHRLFGWKFWAFISGGAALDRETEEFWGRIGYAVVQGYGLTETTSLISVNHPFKLSKGSVGKVLAGREIKLGDDGEILVRGGGVASAYWSGQELQPVANEQGWYRTGDIGELDEKGNLYFKGRSKEVIVTSAGMNVYPEDLESALRRQPEIRECAVVALQQHGNAEPCAVLILSSPEADAQAAVRRTNETLADFQRIHTWFVWPDQDLPRTNTQKPKRSELAKWVSEKLDGQEGATVASPLSQMISQITRRPPTKLRPEDDLAGDLNLSSLDRVELLSALEDRYQVDLSETSFAGASTVADVERMLRGESMPRAIYHYPGWALRWPWSWVRVLVHYTLLRTAVLLLGWPRVSGRENLRGVRGPVLIVCNHIDDVDVGYVLTALPARFRHKLAAAAGGEAMERLRTPPPGRGIVGRALDRLSWTLGAALLNIFPLPRQAGFRRSFAYAGECIDRGYNVLIFPEGHHTIDGKLLPFQSGVGILVNNLRIPVVPMRIAGLFQIKAAGRKFAWPGEVRISIGKPITFEHIEDPAEIAQRLKKIVEEL